MLLDAFVWSGLHGRRELSASYPALDYPLSEASRIAVIGVQVRADWRVRSYPHWRTSELEAWRPQALAGHRSELLSIGELRRRQFLPLRELAFPLVVFSALHEGPLSDEQRDRLWRLYGLPVYEQIRGADETLHGWECDAHEGWHLAPDAADNSKLAAGRIRAAGWRGGEVNGRCACGKAGPRLLVEVRENARENALSRAAGAK
jgi:hypothetical protein